MHTQLANFIRPYRCLIDTSATDNPSHMPLVNSTIPVRSPECEGVAMRDFGGQARARHRKVPWIVGSVLLALGTQYRKGTGRANHCASDWRLETLGNDSPYNFRKFTRIHGLVGQRFNTPPNGVCTKLSKTSWVHVTIRR